MLFDREGLLRLRKVLMGEIWDFCPPPLFLHSLKEIRRVLAYSIMVVRQILVLFVEVRILVGQRSNSETSFRYFYFGIWIPTCGRDFEISKLGKKFVEATA